MSPRRKTRLAMKQQLQAAVETTKRYVQARRARRALPPSPAVLPPPPAPAKRRVTASAKSPTVRRVRLAPSQRPPRRSTRFLGTARPVSRSKRLEPITPFAQRSARAPKVPSSWAPAAPAVLPQRYGLTTLVLLVRDPWWLYAYWEVTPTQLAAVSKQLGPAEPRAPLVLRLYDVTGQPLAGERPQGITAAIAHASRWLDVELPPEADNWFVDTGVAHRTWVAELGYRTTSGRWVAIVRSNVVTTPRAGPSETRDAAWPVTDEAYWKLVGVSYGLGFGTSSLEIRQLLEQRFREFVSSARGSFGDPTAPAHTTTHT